MTKPKLPHVLRIAALLSLCLATRSQAQTDESIILQQLKNRVNHIVNITMSGLGANTNDFNERMTAINAVRPLEVASFDSATITRNISLVLQFVEYLKVHRAAEDSISEILADSLVAIEVEEPTGYEEKALEAFGESFRAQQQAFNDYIAELRQVYSEVLDVLLFLQKAEFDVKGEQLQFRSKSDVAMYEKLMKPLEASSKELARLGKESQKATDLANKKMAAFNGEEPKEPAPKKHSKK